MYPCGPTYDGSLAVYVSGSGIDSNTGLTPSDPLRTIEYAFEVAISWQRDYILVAAGTYDESLFFRNYMPPYGPTYFLGGFNADFSVRDNSYAGRQNPAHRTELTEIVFSESADKVVDGFVLSHLRVSQTNATITNNTFIATGTAGIEFGDARGMVACNYVTAATGTSTSSASLTGISLSSVGGVTLTFNNVVYLLNGLTQGAPIATTGIYVDQSHGYVANNTIIVGTSHGAPATGINADYFVDAVFNNLIDIRTDATSGDTICVRGIPPVFSSVQNNDLHGCSHYWVSQDESISGLSAPSVDGDGATLASQGNIDVTPLLGGADPFHLLSTASPELRAGGRDLTSDNILCDKDGRGRTTSYAGATAPTNPGAEGWSIGAVEMDD